MNTNLSDTRIQAIGELFFRLNDDEQRIARCLYEMLSTGKPGALEALSRRSGVPLSTVIDRLDTWPGVHFNDEGAIVGFWGLAVNAVSNHEIIVDKTTLYAWCAWDTLFIPIVLGKTCHVRAKCKVTGHPIRLEVSPNGVESESPVGVHLSFMLPDDAEFDRDIVTSFCQYVHFFRDQETAAAWAHRQDGGFVLDLDGAIAAAQHKIRFELPQLPEAS